MSNFGPQCNYIWPVRQFEITTRTRGPPVPAINRLHMTLLKFRIFAHYAFEFDAPGLNHLINSKGWNGKHPDSLDDGCSSDQNAPHAVRWSQFNSRYSLHSFPMYTNLFDGSPFCCCTQHIKYLLHSSIQLRAMGVVSGAMGVLWDILTSRMSR